MRDMHARPPEDPWNIHTDAAGRVEEDLALAAGNALRPIYEDIKAKLPLGTHFAVIIDVPGTAAEPGGRIAAMSTNRKFMAPLAMQWAADTMGRS